MIVVPQDRRATLSQTDHKPGVINVVDIQLHIVRRSGRYHDMRGRCRTSLSISTTISTGRSVAGGMASGRSGAYSVPEWTLCT
jgi:hypothetical protein